MEAGDVVLAMSWTVAASLLGGLTTCLGVFDSAMSVAADGEVAIDSVISDGCYSLMESVGGPIGWMAGAERPLGIAIACCPEHCVSEVVFVFMSVDTTAVYYDVRADS